MSATLALPPPRESLCDVLLSTLFIHAASDFWPRYHADLVRALAYEANLQPSEKDPARWEQLKVRAHFAANCCGYYAAARNRRPAA